MWWTEQMIEEFIVANPQRVAGRGAEVVDRQLQLPSGIRLDVLAREPDGGFVIVEIKREKIGRHAICQILEYMGEFMSTGIHANGTVDGDRRWYVPKVRGVLVAPKITHRAANALYALGEEILNLVTVDMDGLDVGHWGGFGATTCAIEHYESKEDEAVKNRIQKIVRSSP